MRHKNMEPADCRCGGHTGICAVCDYGLYVCKVCRGGDATLPTECPGRPLTDEEKELIARGDLDYDMGVWFHEGQPVMRDGKIHK